MKRLFKSYLWMVLLGSLAWASCSDKEVGGSVGGSLTLRNQLSLMTSIQTVVVLLRQ